MSELTIYSIGHSRHPIDRFIELLKVNNIEVLADVRAVARSRWPQFNQKTLIAALGGAGVQYIHFPELGWKVQAPPEDFERGIDELMRLLGERRTAMMCSEGMPDKCHRTLILAPVLKARGVEIVDIYPNGEVR